MSYRSARQKAGKTVTETARYMAVSMVSVWQWETGVYNPSADKLVKLAAYYGCTVDELLRDNPNSKERNANAE